MVITKEAIGSQAYLRVYEAWFQDQGLAVLNDAKVVTILQILAKVMNPKHPDVILDPKPTTTLTHGVVSLSMRWNFQELKPVNDRGFMTTGFDEICVMARVATKEVVVTTNEKNMVLDEQEWRIPGVLESAVVQACQHPLRFGGGYAYIENGGVKP